MTGYPFDGYDGTDESFERLQEEQDRQEREQVRSARITVNGWEFTGEQLIRLLHHVYWKQTSGASLDMISGCQAAAEVTAHFLSGIGEDYHPGGRKQDISHSVPRIEELQNPG